uniref:Secreted protein n=1 Tax=Rhizophora mucronata TaxID=61149 RepID=A0A2P2L2S4_RHIMU
MPILSFPFLCLCQPADCVALLLGLLSTTTLPPTEVTPAAPGIHPNGFIHFVFILSSSLTFFAEFVVVEDLKRR